MSFHSTAKTNLQIAVWYAW